MNNKKIHSTYSHMGYINENRSIKSIKEGLKIRNTTRSRLGVRCLCSLNEAIAHYVVLFPFFKKHYPLLS